MQEVETTNITLRQAKELFGPLLSNHQSGTGARFGSYRALNALRNSGQGIWKGFNGAKENIHHILEQRILQYCPQCAAMFAADEITSVTLSVEEHAVYTARWLEAIARRRMLAFRSGWTPAEILEAARTMVYFDSPALMNALELMFL